MPDCLFTSQQVSDLMSMVYTLLPGFISDLDDRLDSIDSVLSDISDKIDVVDGIVDTIKSDVESVTTGLPAIKTQTANIYSEVCNTSWGLAAIADAVSDVEVLVSDVKTIGNNIYTDTHITLPATLSDISDAIAAIDFSGLEDKVDIIDSLLDSYLPAISTAVSACASQSSVNTLQSDVSGTKSDVTTIKTEIHSATYGLSAIKNQALSAYNEAHSTYVVANNIYTRVNSSEYGLYILKGYVDELESLLKNSTYGLSALKTLIDGLSSSEDMVNMLFESLGLDYHSSVVDGVYVLKGKDSIEDIVKYENNLPNWNKLFKIETLTPGEYIYMNEILCQFMANIKYYQ